MTMPTYGSPGRRPVWAAAVVILVPAWLAVAVGRVGLEGRLVGARTFAVLGRRRCKRTPFRVGRWKVPLTLACASITMLSLAPVLALAIRAGPAGLAEMPVWIRSSLWNSMRAAALAATAITALGLTGAWAFARGRAGGRLLDATLMLGFLIPGAVLGVGRCGRRREQRLLGRPHKLPCI